MTNEEIINEVLNIKKFNYTLAPSEVFDTIINLLKQEPKDKGKQVKYIKADILDKIKAEIEQYQADYNLSCSDNANCSACTRITFGSICQIIDKYKAESEDRSGSTM